MINILSTLPALATTANGGCQGHSRQRWPAFITAPRSFYFLFPTAVGFWVKAGRTWWPCAAGKGIQIVAEEGGMSERQLGNKMRPCGSAGFAGQGLCGKRSISGVLNFCYFFFKKKVIRVIMGKLKRYRIFYNLQSSQNPYLYTKCTTT